MKYISLLKVSSAVLALLCLTGLALADEISDAYDALKKAQEAKNAADVKKWAVETSRLARAEAAKPQPAEASEVEYWKQRVEYAKSTDAYTEYALGATALMPDLPPAQVVDLVETLITQNPKSTYISMAAPVYIAALARSGADKQIEGATKLLASVPDSEDALYALAEGNLTRQRADQAITYATRLLSTLGRKAKPEGMSDADWNTKKSGLTGRGNYIAGVGSCMRELWPECDRYLRAAVPLIGNQAALTGPTFFYLGLANYRIGLLTNSRPKIQEAIKFSNQSAAIAGPMQNQARQNAYAMEKDLAKIR
jgi:hypothetical protein